MLLRAINLWIGFLGVRFHPRKKTSLFATHLEALASLGDSIDRAAYILLTISVQFASCCYGCMAVLLLGRQGF